MSSLVDTSLDSSTSQGQEIMQIETQIWVSLVSLIPLGHTKKVHESRTSSTNINYQSFLKSRPVLCLMGLRVSS